MSKEMNKIKDTVMLKIRHDEIKMRPRIYFVVGSALTLVGLICSIVTSVFFVSLIKFSLRTHGPMGQYRLDQILTSFSWWLPVIAVASLVVGVLLLRNYSFSYKHNFWFVVTVFIIAVISAGIIINSTGLDDVWLRRGPMRGIMHKPPL